MSQVIGAFVAVILGVGTMLLYFFGTNYVLDSALPDKTDGGGNFISREKQRETIRPWLFVAPAVLILGL
ncbi:MAG: alpha-glucoside ABC transporter permease, partial [Chloroflexota bacterium]